MLGARCGRFFPPPAPPPFCLASRWEELAVSHETLQADGSLPRE